MIDPVGEHDFLFTSESVTEGHPDKMADQISDAVLDAALANDPESRVACETLLTTCLVVGAGEVATPALLDVNDIVRATIRRIGYTPACGFDADSCAVLNVLGKQSLDIARGVDAAHEMRVSASEDLLDSAGAGDQGMMFGYATNETPELMPMPIALAHRLAARLAETRKSGVLPFLRPDGKTQVSVRYADGKPVAVEKVLISTQHEDGSEHLLQDSLWSDVVREVLPPDSYDAAELRKNFLVNPTGRFVIGGPVGDAGLTGRKIIVDTYGGVVRHGGGAFSGKDPTKVDRSAAYATRWVAKNVVASGLARRCEVQVCYAIGTARPLAVSLETFDTAEVPDDQLLEAVQEVFDLRPGAIIRELKLRRPIFAATAAYGHFGRTDIDAPWEETNRVDALLAHVEKRAAPV